MYKYIKNICDFVFALLAMIMLAPLFIIIALTIKLSGMGSVFVKQERIGKNKKVFNLYKFRTMRKADSNLEEAFVAKLINREYEGMDVNPKKKLSDDPRFTKLGYFLKRFSLDELPTYISIIYGDMSVVGPRPLIKFENDLYEKIPKERFDVKPGLTGLWQLNSLTSSNYTFDEMLNYDITYVRNLSFFLDLKIIFNTVLGIFRY